jgi:hypothetical protein
LPYSYLEEIIFCCHIHEETLLAYSHPWTKNCCVHVHEEKFCWIYIHEHKICRVNNPVLIDKTAHTLPGH